MKNLTPESELCDYYQQMTLDDDRAAAILDARELALSARRWKRRAIAASVGMAAMTLVAIGLFARGQFHQSDAPVARASAPPAQQPIDPPVDRETRPFVAARDSQGAADPNAPTPQQYRLVSVRSHGDGCPHCRATGEVHRELQQAFMGTTLTFDQINLGDAAARSENQQRLVEYRMDDLVAGRQETAFLVLTSLDGQQVREFKPSVGAAQIAQQIRQTIEENR